VLTIYSSTRILHGHCQASLIWIKFRDARLDTIVEANPARNNSLAQVQGDEELIALVSFCTNNPKHKLTFAFAYEKYGLTVDISRARVLLLLSGNSKPWVGGKRNSVEGFFPNMRYRGLDQLLERLCEQRDSVDCMIVSLNNSSKGEHNRKSKTKGQVDVKDEV
jgi:hypothetical protein